MVFTGTPRLSTDASAFGALPCCARPNSIRLLQYTQLLYTESAAVSTTMFSPWHFAVKTMLILYGVADTDALNFVLIVHSVQTLLVVALGVYAWAALSMTKKKENFNQ